MEGRPGTGIWKQHDFKAVELSGATFSALCARTNDYRFGWPR